MPRPALTGHLLRRRVGAHQCTPVLVAPQDRSMADHHEERHRARDGDIEAMRRIEKPHEAALLPVRIRHRFLHATHCACLEHTARGSAFAAAISVCHCSCGE